MLNVAIWHSTNSYIGGENRSGLKEYEGMVEKDFTIVTFADMRVKDEKKEYYLKLNTDGKDSAKCPPIFMVDDQDIIPNDSNAFLGHIREVLNNN